MLVARTRTQYFDENTYVDDFHALDKNGDGGENNLYQFC